LAEENERWRKDSGGKGKSQEDESLKKRDGVEGDRSRNGGEK